MRCGHCIPERAWRKPDPSQAIGDDRLEGSAVSSADHETEVLAQRVDDAERGSMTCARAIARRRRWIIRRTPDRLTFMINGHVWTKRVDEDVRLGDTEEWTIVNTISSITASTSIRRPSW